MVNSLFQNSNLFIAGFLKTGLAKNTLGGEALRTLPLADLSRNSLFQALEAWNRLGSPLRAVSLTSSRARSGFLKLLNYLLLVVLQSSY